MLLKRKKNLSCILMSLFISASSAYSISAMAGDPYFATTVEATTAATALGYLKTN